MARFGEYGVTERSPLDLSLHRYILETHRVWLDESLTLDLYTVPCSGSCHHGIDLHGNLKSHKKRNQQHFTTRENRSGIADLAIVFGYMMISIGYMRRSGCQRSYTRDLTCKGHDRTWLVYCTMVEYLYVYPHHSDRHKS